MATSTTNLKLIKPAATDLYSVETFNSNFDTIDAAFGTSLEDIIAAAILANDKKKHPVGTIIMSTSDANPSTYMGFGTWAAWGSGRVPVGVNTGDTDFATVEKTGGAKTHTHTQGATGAASGNTSAATGNTGAASGNTGSTTLTTSQIPSHSHSLSTDGDHTHGLGNQNGNSPSSLYVEQYLKGWAGNITTGSAGSHSHTVGSTGGGGGHTHTLNSHTHTLNSHTHTLNSHTHTNPTTAAASDVQPYITCYMWKRTA
jgi:hypothetical protein